MTFVAKEHDCTRELHSVALRATPARVAIMQLLESTTKPVDAAAIMVYLKKKDITTDPATVFRIMNMFTQKGLTAPIHFQEGKTRYELANKEDHHHLICETCSRVEDVQDTVIPELERYIKKKHHFVVKRHSLEFFGLCAHCQQ